MIRKEMKADFLRHSHSLKHSREKIISFFLMLSGYFSLIIFLLIFVFLFFEASKAFISVDPLSFIFDHNDSPTGSFNKLFEWYPTSENPKYSILPLLAGTFLTAVFSTLISSILGIISGIYLSEIATPRTREILKPLFEFFSGIPTVVIGFFLLSAGAVFFQDMLGINQKFNALLASTGLSLIIIPIVASLTEEALRAVPDHLRVEAYSLGASKWQTTRLVILPAAYSGISAAIVLGFSRAIGETMIVLMASGNAGELSFNLLQSIRTISATLASEMGEVIYNSEHFFALFVLGTFLFIFTFLLNVAASFLSKRSARWIRRL